MWLKTMQFMETAFYLEKQNGGVELVKEIMNKNFAHEIAKQITPHLEIDIINDAGDSSIIRPYPVDQLSAHYCFINKSEMLKIYEGFDYILSSTRDHTIIAGLEMISKAIFDDGIHGMKDFHNQIRRLKEHQRERTRRGTLRHESFVEWEKRVTAENK